MGRPLNDKFFASVGGGGPLSKDGLQIFLFSASFIGGPTDVPNAWIVRQRSTERYEVTDGAGHTEVLRMFNGDTPPEGRCSLRALPFEEEPTEFIRTFSAHHVKTFDGNTYIWSHLQNGEDADEVGEVDFFPPMDQIIV